LIADVHCRRGVANTFRRFELSAVQDFDRAASTYRELRAEGARNHDLDYVRVLSRSAHLSLIGLMDPDVASVAADLAISTYLKASSALSPGDLVSMCQACEAASVIHAANGRLAIALQADELGVHCGRMLRERGNPGAASTLASALARRAVHLQAAGRKDEGDACWQEALGSSARAAQTAKECWQWTLQPDDDIHNTLAAALEIARGRLGEARIGTRLTSLVHDTNLSAPELGGRELIAFPSARCHPQLAAVVGGELMQCAVDLLPGEPKAALRLLVEAHCLIQSGMRARASSARHGLQDFGPAWAEALLRMSRAVESEPLARDLAEWAYMVARQLVPFTFTEGGQRLKPLIRECLTRHSALLEASGDLAACSAVRRELAEWEAGSR
jgi:hypothetical protein